MTIKWIEAIGHVLQGLAHDKHHGPHHERCGCGDFKHHSGHYAHGPSCGGKHGCCEIPQTECPPRCVGELAWKIRRGAVPHANVEVRNVGKVARTFTFSASELSGTEIGNAKLIVDPPAVNLAPGASELVRVRLAHSADLHAGQTYRAELRIRGAWEQCVELRCEVRPDPHDSVYLGHADLFESKLLGEVAGKRIDWDIDRGVVPEAAITIHNDHDSPQSFAFSVSPLVGAGVGSGAEAAQLVLSVDSMLLGPGQRNVLRLKLDQSMALHQCQTYRGDVVVRTNTERRAHVSCKVEPDAFAHCEVEQGEAPTRIVAHHWYHHFQCTEPCVPGAT